MSEIKFIYENKINIGINSKAFLRKFTRPSTLISLGLLVHPLLMGRLVFQ